MDHQTPDHGAAADIVLAVEGRHRPSRRRRLTSVGLALGLVVGTGLVVAIRDGQRSPEDALAAVSAFVADSKSAHLEGTIETIDGNPGDVGQVSTSRSRVSGDIGMPEQAHLVVDNGDSFADRSWFPAAATSDMPTTRPSWPQRPGCGAGFRPVRRSIIRRRISPAFGPRWDCRSVSRLSSQTACAG